MRRDPNDPLAESPAASLVGLRLAAGNRAVAGLLSRRLVQRKIEWSDAVKAGEAWNAGEKLVGNIRRIPLEGLGEGMQTDSAKRWKKDPKDPKKGKLVDEPTEIAALSPEKAKGKAIVLVPAKLDATQKIEVVVFLHGWTEGTHRPYAGWRALVMAPAKPTTKKKTPKEVAAEELLERLRRGRNEKDVAPVRDVALDEVAQQLEESTHTQTVIVLPQGGLHSQFGKAGHTTFEADAYVKEVVGRLQTEDVWKDAKGKKAEKAPEVGRVTMAGHSGAGATLSKLAGSSKISGDLVLYDAIHGDEVRPIIRWTEQRLNEALAAVKKDPDQAETYLKRAQKLRGYFSSDYRGNYKPLVDAIDAWFKTNGAKLGKYEAAVRANFVVKPVALTHEELMRGTKAGTARAKNTGGIYDALTGLRR